MSHLLQDLRHGLRGLLKSPGFTTAAVLVLALGVGANTAIFSVVDAVLLRPLPYPDADRLVAVYHTPPKDAFPGITKFSVSAGNYFDWESQNRVFDAMSIVHFGALNLTGQGDPEALTAARVSRDFFGVLKVRPLLGRVFTQEETGEGRRLVILSNAAWKARFGGDPTIVGRDVRLDGEPYRVVGILREGSDLIDGVQVWVPMQWNPKDRAVRDNHNGYVIARLKPGADLGKAQADMDVISQRLEHDYPEADKRWGAVVVPLREDLVGDVRPMLLALLGAVALVLLIGCANVANLVLARTLGRRKEIAVRTALGASRARLVEQLVAETVLLSLLGGALGLLLARLGVTGIVAFLADRLPRAGEVSMSAPVFLFALAVSVAAGVLAGIVPAWRATKTDIATSLKEGLGRTDADATGQRTRGLLIAAEVALSLALVAGAGLLIRSLWMLQRVDPGFDPANVVTMSVMLPDTKYAEKEKQTQFFREAEDKIRALPGVASVGLVDSLPMTGGGNWPVQVEGQPILSVAQQPNVTANVVLGDYFQTMRIPLRAGRLFTEADRADGPGVAVISESMAKKFWPGENALGKRFVTAFFPEKPREVVGIVGDVKKRGLALIESVPSMYFPIAQIPVPRMAFAVRTRNASLAPAAVAAIHQVDPAQPVARVGTMTEIVADSLSRQRSTMLLLCGFAALAVVLAVIGIYSVLSYVVRRRGREIGIRVALGAQARDVVRLVVGQGMRPVAAGIAVGLDVAFAFGRLLSTLVFGISEKDPLTLSAVAALLALVALAACLVPARQALRVGALRALRDD
jgi:predicted permease